MHSTSSLVCNHTDCAGTLLLLLLQDNNPELFRLARVGLGSLGVVTELTLQCVPAHQLEERTFVLTPQQIQQQHVKLLRKNKHLRYMWIPFTDSVVVVTNNPVTKVSRCCGGLSCMYRLLRQLDISRVLCQLHQTIHRKCICANPTALEQQCAKLMQLETSACGCHLPHSRGL